MIAKLTGLLDSIAQDWLILDVHGVGYHINANGQTLSQLSSYLGQNIVLFIEPIIRNEQTHLFGFLTLEDRAWFRLLTSIQGVGPKVALAIQSILNPSDLEHSLTFSDDQHIRRADGVGPKLALRIVTELKNKRPPVDFVQTAHMNPDVTSLKSYKDAEVKSPMQTSNSHNSSFEKKPEKINNTLMDALMGLTSLGYTKSEAAQVLNSLGDDSKNLPLQELIKKALSLLAPIR